MYYYAVMRSQTLHTLLAAAILKAAADRESIHFGILPLPEKDFKSVLLPADCTPEDVMFFINVAPTADVICSVSDMKNKTRIYMDNYHQEHSGDHFVTTLKRDGSYVHHDLGVSAVYTGAESSCSAIARDMVLNGFSRSVSLYNHLKQDPDDRSIKKLYIMEIGFEKKLAKVGIEKMLDFLMKEDALEKLYKRGLKAHEKTQVGYNLEPHPTMPPETEETFDSIGIHIDINAYDVELTDIPGKIAICPFPETLEGLVDFPTAVLNNCMEPFSFTYRYEKEADKTKYFIRRSEGNKFNLKQIYDRYSPTNGTVRMLSSFGEMFDSLVFEKSGPPEIRFVDKVRRHKSGAIEVDTFERETAREKTAYEMDASAPMEKPVITIDGLDPFASAAAGILLTSKEGIHQFLPPEDQEKNTEEINRLREFIVASNEYRALNPDKILNKEIVESFIKNVMKL